MGSIVILSFGIIFSLTFVCISSQNIVMLYMIIEKFHPGKVKALYQRFSEKGRMLPEGVTYINSWINEPVTICYQLMESSSAENIYEWISHWNDLADFEVIPVITSAQAKEKVFAAGG